MSFFKPHVRNVAAVVSTLALSTACDQTGSGQAASVADPEGQEVEGQDLKVQSVEKLYLDSCAKCHEKGVVNAPKTGDRLAWQTRLDKGMDVLVKHAKDGYQAMPPKGLCMTCGEEDYRELILYMSQTPERN